MQEHLQTEEYFTEIGTKLNNCYTIIISMVFSLAIVGCNTLRESNWDAQI